MALNNAVYACSFKIFRVASRCRRNGRRWWSFSLHKHVASHLHGPAIAQTTLEVRITAKTVDDFARVPKLPANYKVRTFASSNEALRLDSEPRVFADVAG